MTPDQFPHLLSIVVNDALKSGVPAMEIVGTLDMIKVEMQTNMLRCAREAATVSPPLIFLPTDRGGNGT